MTPLPSDAISPAAALRRDAILADAARSMRRFHARRRALLRAAAALPAIALALVVAYTPLTPRTPTIIPSTSLRPTPVPLAIRSANITTDPSILARLAVPTSPLSELSLTRVLDDDALMQSAADIAAFAGLVRVKGRIVVAFHDGREMPRGSGGSGGAARARRVGGVGGAGKAAAGRLRRPRARADARTDPCPPATRIAPKRPRRSW